MTKHNCCCKVVCKFVKKCKLLLLITLRITSFFFLTHVQNSDIYTGSLDWGWLDCHTVLFKWTHIVPHEVTLPSGSALFCWNSHPLHPCPDSTHTELLKHLFPPQLKFRTECFSHHPVSPCCSETVTLTTFMWPGHSQLSQVSRFLKCQVNRCVSRWNNYWSIFRPCVLLCE